MNESALARRRSDPTDYGQTFQGGRCEAMLRAGLAPAAYGGLRMGGSCNKRRVANVNSVAALAPARAGQLQPQRGLGNLRRCSLFVHAPHLELSARRGSLSTGLLRVRSLGERTAEVRPAVCLTLGSTNAGPVASQTPQAGAPITVWLKRMDVAGAQYVAVKGVDLQQSVDDFKARWVVQAKLDVDPSLVTLRLVGSSEAEPKAGEEEECIADAAKELRPRLTLADAGLTDGCSLLAFVAIVGNIATVLPARVLSVASRARGRQQVSEWHVSTQVDLDRHLAHGLLWLMDLGGKLVRSVVVLSELSHEPSAKYYFQLTSEAGAVESATAAIKNLASGAERESTRGIADDKLVQQAYGAVSVLFGGEPFEFCDGEQLVLEVDGLLGTEDCAWVLLNSAKLTAGKADVYEAVGSASKLHSLLRSMAISGHPSLARYAGARVHAFLSASHFLPGVPELAVQQGVTPVLCSGKRYHVPEFAAASLPVAQSSSAVPDECT